MAIGLCVVPSPLSTNTWVAGPMITDPMDLNHREAQAHHARWAAAVKAALEEAERKQAELVAESERKAAEARNSGARPVPPKANTTSRTQTVPGKTQPPALPRDQWMETFNYWSARLPGIWSIEDKGSWGAAVPDTGQVFIARRTPLHALKSIMLHEAGHVRQGQVFGGCAGMARVLGPCDGSPRGLVERTADCWAQARGATFLTYGCDAEARNKFAKHPF